MGWKKRAADFVRNQRLRTVGNDESYWCAITLWEQNTVNDVDHAISCQ